MQDGDIDSMYLRYPSAYIVLNASDVFPAPLTPTTAVICDRGIETSIFLRLFVLTPFT